MKMRLFEALVVASLAVASPAQAKTKSDIDFTFPSGKAVKIVVLRPDVQVGSLGTSGLETPNADWTGEGRKNFAAALEQNITRNAQQVVFMPEQTGENAQLVADYQALFRAVSGAIFQHKFFGPKLPTKKGKFDWTLGPEVKKLGELSGGNYALLLYTHDAYGTSGRKALQVVAFLALGAVVQAGIHQAYASLVDLDTGQVVWFNVKLGAGGDPREAAGAAARIDQLLSTLPGRVAAAQPTT